ncbi:hypothetical protein SAMN05444166_4907 [Singulisphaera sp. GP187]|uniref:hypothetical protein n=1 Tax=Singulisphaera sp. GP187 TaxID=1882752 RepID=UPI00092B4D42|nr:hypothetical protein [Singulisphaera sp. GP187]SIO45908.1 hypothetical protein SAMN05444166_4907 [Singulisphaera sp. GP187]
MSRLICLFVAIIGLVNLPGCGSGESLPAVPTTDTRPPETKEADDQMTKNNAKVNAGLK